MSLLDTASLIVTPNGYKEGKLYSVIPSDGSGDMSVTRATTATRVNSGGLVELVPYNLLTYSEDFSNAVWNKNEVTLTSGQSSPLGTNTAFKITGNSAVNAYLYHSTVSVISGNVYTASVYLKGDTSGSVSFRVDSPASGNNPISYTTEWQRFTYTFTAGSSTADVVLGAYATWTGNEAIYVYGFQLVEGSTAKDYQKTETRLNILRLDYSNGTCPSLLVEPQRTNLALYGQDFSSNWFKQNATTTPNSGTSPFGINNATKYTITANGAYMFQSIASINTATISCFVKKINSDWVWVGANIAGIGDNGASFDIVNGSVGTILGTGITASIEDYGNGWFRCIVTRDFALASPLVVVVPLSGDNNFTNQNGKEYLIYGYQVEAGSYATSYIPTTSSSVTRNADVISKTGISSLIGQTEGTLFWDVDFNVVANNDAILLKDNASYDTFVFMQKESSGIIACGYYGSGALQARIESSAVTTGRHKIAFAYKNNDFVMYLNGTQVGTDTSGTVSGLMDYFDLHWTQSGCNNVYASALWKTRLTNTQLAQLTTI